MKCADLKYVTLHPEDQSRFSYDFTAFESIPTKTEYTFVGMGSHPDVFDAYDRLVLLWLELPNCLVHRNRSCLGHYSYTLDKLPKIEKVLTNCPFSVDYFNETFNTDKFMFAYAPINPLFVPAPEERIYDVFYAGHLPCPISFALPAMQQFKLCVVSRSGGTHRDVAHKEKLRLNAQSKITITHGLLTWPDPGTKQVFPTHKAFEYLDQSQFVPQIKIRTFEAAMAKSIILSLHDPWNMIESYLEPDKDFIYWTDAADLEEKVRHILSHYDDYLPMAESAFKKVMDNYTTTHFFNQFLKDL